MYTLILDENMAVAKAKTINYAVNNSSEIEITEELYNAIELPCSLTIIENKVVAWEKVVLPTLHPVVIEPTFEERLKATEDAINNILGL